MRILKDWWFVITIFALPIGMLLGFMITNLINNPPLLNQNLAKSGFTLLESTTPFFKVTDEYEVLPAIYKNQGFIYIAISNRSLSTGSDNYILASNPVNVDVMLENDKVQASSVLIKHFNNGQSKVVGMLIMVQYMNRTYYLSDKKIFMQSEFFKSISNRMSAYTTSWNEETKKNILESSKT